MPIPNYLRRASVALLITGFVFVALPPLLRLFDIHAGSFGIELLDVLAGAAVLFAGILHLALATHKKLFPRFHSYQAESLEGEGKLFENLTDELREPLYVEANIYPERLNQLIERRKVAQFQFIVRCVRISFSLLCLAFLVVLFAFVVSQCLTALPPPAL